MYKLTWILVAFFALAFSVLAAPVDLEKRASNTVHKGRGTWYYTGLGACGWTNSNSQLVVAMPQSLYDANNGKNCGQSVYITYGSKSVTAEMVDSCPGCGGNDLDMSEATFKSLAPLSDGVIEVEWQFK